jgi:hypothetical protein
VEEGEDGAPLVVMNVPPEIEDRILGDNEEISIPFDVDLETLANMGIRGAKEAAATAAAARKRNEK